MNFSIALALVVCLVGAVVAAFPRPPAPPSRFAVLGFVAFGVGLFFVLEAVKVLRVGP